MRLWFGRVRRMRAPDYATAIEVLALAVWVEVALRVMPFSRLLERLKHSPHVTISGDEYQRLLRYVAVAYDVLPFPATCLRRSVVLYGLLERCGVASRVCFGVAKSGSALDAHAWVECDGVTPDSGSLHFTTLAPPAEELPHVVNEQLRFL
jgi:Transglutaminase-like superfamily